jgi:hypothetical protein
MKTIADCPVDEICTGGDIKRGNYTFPLISKIVTQ